MFRFAHDKWNSKEDTFKLPGILAHDKVQHFIGGLLLALISPLASMIFWALWEVKDALLPWEHGYYTWFPFIGKMNWGGDGFSYKDMISSWIGAIIIFSLTLIL
jgi:hypothetical protein